MRVFTLQGTAVSELAALPETAPGPDAFVWISCSREEFAASAGALQAALRTLAGASLVDLHVSDLLNAQQPSHHEDTSEYDLLVFRRLATTSASAGTETEAPASDAPRQRRTGPPILRRIDTSPIGFAVFDRVLLTVHPADCAVRDAYATRLLATSSEPAAAPATAGAAPTPTDARSAGARGVPANPPDMMLRIVNQIVDGYLALRRELTRQLDHWQQELLDPRGRFSNWQALLDARMGLHQLDDLCEDQRSAIQDWIEALKGWAPPASPAATREREMLLVRSRDVLEHIERVAHHVRRLEQNAETAVQMHFSAQGHRTNDIMRTLTAITAVFLPLNLITGFFGMNFEFLPLIHSSTGLWLAVGLMALVAVGLVVVFWRKRYLARSGR